MNVGENSSRGNGDTSEELVQLFVVLDSQRDVTGNDATLFVIARGVASQLQDFSSEVLEHGSEVNGCTGSHAGRVLAQSQVPTNATHGKLQARFGTAARRLLLVAAASLALSFTTRWRGEGE